MLIPHTWFDKVGKTQRRAVGQDSGGGVIVTYADYLTNVPMRIVPAAGGETGGQSRLTSQNPTTIYVQGAPDILTTDRIVWDASVYDLTSVNNPDEQGVYLIISGYQVLPSGVGA